MWNISKVLLNLFHQKITITNWDKRTYQLPSMLLSLLFVFTVFLAWSNCPQCAPFIFFISMFCFFFLASTTCLLSYLGNISFRVLNCLLSKHLWATSLPNISTAGPQVNKEHPHLTTYNWIYLFFFCLTPGLSHNLSRRDEEFCLT